MPDQNQKASPQSQRQSQSQVPSQFEFTHEELELIASTMEDVMKDTDYELTQTTAFSILTKVRIKAAFKGD